MEAAQERAAAAERRALMEIEQERQARARADKALEALREKLSESEARERRQSLEHAEAATRAQMELNAKSAALQRAVEAQDDLQRELGSLRTRLAAAQQTSAGHEAEAQTLKTLVERLAPPAGVRGAQAGGSRRKNKAGGS